jgi:16S rRNA processing protein RimM
LAPERSESEERWVTVARLGRAWGRRGELIADSLTSGAERFTGVKGAYLFGPEGAGSGPGGAADVPRSIGIESVWEHRGRLVFKFQGVDSIDDAEPLQGAEVRLPRSERAPLADGEFYQSDLIGCEVVERSNGERVGAVVDWVDNGGPLLLEVRGEGKPILIPFVKAICVEIDVPGRRIAVELPEGLKDL